MLAALLADAASKAVCRGGLYHTLAEIILEKAEASGPGMSPPSISRPGISRPGS